jgi:hypothetical protein
MALKKDDEFANLATITTVESAANTLTFQKLETGISLNEKVAWVINRIEYEIPNYLSADFNLASDGYIFGISVSNTATSMYTSSGLRDGTVLDRVHIERVDFGAAASGGVMSKIWLKDFSTLPGGGLIVPPVPLYGFAQGQSAVSALTVCARIYYTLLQLQVDL